MQRSRFICARQKRTIPRVPIIKEKPKPFVRPTISPNVWSTSDVSETESSSFAGTSVNIASRYFELHGPQARFIPPSEFSYELPSAGVPEIAFAGRSNVGKSTLLATLLGHKNLVRTSKTPGCTGSVNYFAIGENGNRTSPSMYLVDLPGYGFAKVSKKDQNRWSMFLTDFLSKRGFMTLRRVLLLIDSRRGPSPEDWRLMEVLSDANVTFQLVLTKADMVTPMEQQARVMQLFDELKKWKLIRPTHLPFVHIVSSKAPVIGMDELRFSLCQGAGISL